jgi:hypothetical protein
MLDRLRCAALLRGWRGRPAVSVDELAVLISTVSQLLAARTDIDEIELNPVRVGPSGALAVDALVIPRSPKWSRPTRRGNPTSRGPRQLTEELLS